MSQPENPFNVTDQFLYSEFCNKIDSYNNSVCLKNNAKSAEFRKEGNKFFGKDQFEDSLRYFVKVVVALILLLFCQKNRSD